MENLLAVQLRIRSMRKKNKVTIWLLFLSIAYMVLCCLLFFSLAMVVINFVISHKIELSSSDIKQTIAVSVIAGTAAALRSWIFAKIDERKARKSHPSDPQ